MFQIVPCVFIKALTISILIDRNSDPDLDSIDPIVKNSSDATIFGNKTIKDKLDCFVIRILKTIG